ncbi:ATP-binding cassette domain-containing protein [Robertmurraya sp. DFI.2.37]|uniref:ATP-binding cassette domain-containing protein n=1 Tax=Robertmurraya sp. DFI.2.37 TaxID=3031819 RepID=UPI001CD9C8A6|nr:ATP-binding cassette domain-containing protein [Robertmurraya sp. DFI.2.37]MDF1509143.1 ATP-binding cassette domain-containing protein [Robertmurraya sp. DFI.2.37]
MLESIIVVKDFVKKYGSFTAVNKISFEVKRGSIFALLGPNGAGKSTTINTLCTISEKTSGFLTIDGKDVSREKEAVRREIGVVFQDSTLDQKMTVEENLRMHAHFYAIPKSLVNERIVFCLRVVDLLEWRKEVVGRLSGGMKRRVELARSLLHLPKLLILDEPTTGLDPQTRTSIWDYLIKLQKEEDLTILLTTHYMDEAEICNQVAVIDHGKVVAFDQPKHLKEKYTKDKAYLRTSNEQELERLLKDGNFVYHQNSFGEFMIEVNHLSELLKMMNEHSPYITDMEIKKGTLNDVFLEITGSEIRG